MEYKVIKTGKGAVYSSRGNEVVATGLTWQEAYNFVHAQAVGGSWDYWFTSVNTHIPAF